MKYSGIEADSAAHWCLLGVRANHSPSNSAGIARYNHDTDPPVNSLTGFSLVMAMEGVGKIKQNCLHSIPQGIKKTSSQKHQQGKIE